MLKPVFLFFLALLANTASAQLLVSRDTITVRENGYVLKMPWANGINYEFEIFNRWGEKLFSTKNPKQGWNGYFKGG